MGFKDEVAGWFRNLQIRICNELEKIDSPNKFREDDWERTGGGGGHTRIIHGKNIIEKGGVNFSAVHGLTPDFLKKQYQSEPKSQSTNFFASGVSIVIHPVNPMVPIIHMNVRYFEMGSRSWFGGGIDLTPHYVNRDDATFFHSSLKAVCDKFNPHYDKYKKDADDYFYIPHRNETRGIGGIFFDKLESAENISMKEHFDFVKAIGELFIPVYSELVIRNKDKVYDEDAVHWQRLRRGRYVEFNLVYDRGTRFGLETDGRTESILMSLPPMAEWTYDYKPNPGSEEEITLNSLKKGIDWIKR